MSSIENDSQKLTNYKNGNYNSTLEIIADSDNMFTKHLANQQNEMQKSKLRWVILMLICISSVNYIKNIKKY